MFASSRGAASAATRTSLGERADSARTGPIEFGASRATSTRPAGTCVAQGPIAPAPASAEVERIDAASARARTRGTQRAAMADTRAWVTLAATRAPCLLSIG